MHSMLVGSGRVLPIILALILLGSLPSEGSESSPGFRGKVVDICSEEPISGAVVSVKSLGISTVTNSNGVYQLSTSAGIYQVSIQAPGFIDMSATLQKVIRGIVTNLHFEMIPKNLTPEQRNIVDVKLMVPQRAPNKAELDALLEVQGFGIPKLQTASIPSTITVLMPEGDVETMDMDEYLKGVLPKEMAPGWPMEALKAQAVAARCFGAVHPSKYRHPQADVCTSPACCQAWSPYHYSDTDSAVVNTHNVVATYDASIIQAFYFGHCDGHTRNSEDVWGGYLPYCRSVSCICGYTTLYGHGVGMCQRGAQAMANGGYNYEHILTHYYTGINIEGQNPPTVETVSATNVTETAATLNATITDDGVGSIDERRFSWGITSSCSDGWVTDDPGSDRYGDINVSGSSFSHRLAGLEPDTTYYFQAWAHNSTGWDEGDPLSFTTTVSDALPNVDAFDVEPRSVTLDNSFTIFYTVTDDIGLQQTELWRATDTDGDGQPNWPDKAEQTTPLSGQTSYSGSFNDAPSSPGTYWYGMHVVDNSGDPEHWNDESNSRTGGLPGVYGPIKVTVYLEQQEEVSSPSGISGPSSTYVNKTESYAASGASSNLGHSLEYRFDWGDGNISGWGSATQSRSWSGSGTFHIKAQARCATHTDKVSSWSGTLSTVTVSYLTLSTNVNPSGAGSVTKNPNKSGYTYNESVQLTANANSGYTFSHWSGDASGASNPISITMNSNESITANFSVSEKPSIAKDKPIIDLGSTLTSDTFQVWNDGTGTLIYDVLVTSGSSYFSVQPTSGSSTDSSDRKTHTVMVNRNNITAGQTVSGTVTISSADADNSPQYISLSASQVDEFWKSPTATGKSDNEWTSPTYAYSSDDNYATATGTYLEQDYYNFNFGLPSGATPTGIQVKIEGHGYLDGDGYYRDSRILVYIWSASSSSWGRQVGGGWWAFALNGDETLTKPDGTADLWGTSGLSDFDNANFKLRIQTFSSPYLTYIDRIQVKVYYTEPPPPCIISGYIRTSENSGISGVTMSGLPDNQVTNGNGYYNGTVDYGWSGTVTPTKAGYAFDPAYRIYSNVTTNQTAQNYTGTPEIVGDFCGPNFGPPDGYVDVWDLMQFADHWHTSTGDSNWDSKFDLTGPNFGDLDDYVDVWDLMVFADHWHEGQKP